MTKFQEGQPVYGGRMGVHCIHTMCSIQELMISQGVRSTIKESGVNEYCGWYILYGEYRMVHHGCFLYIGE